MSWLQRLFCGRTVAELERCIEVSDGLNAQVDSLLEDLDHSAELLGACVEEKKRLRDEATGVYQKWADAMKDAAYYHERLVAVEALLAQSLVIPQLAIDEAQLVVVKPREHPLISSFDLVTADLEYYKLSYSKWVEVLGLVQPQVKKGLKSYHPEISDCDDYAYVMGALLAIAFRHAGLHRQGAFMVTWSNVHAYNAFMDTDDNVWIYEPQNGEIVGKLGETADPYGTRLVWFPHEAAR